jgi:hypothetical protein
MPSSPRKVRNFWTDFKSLGTPRNHRAEPDAECPPRRIFIDAGARLGDTLDFFKQSKNQLPQLEAYTRHGKFLLLNSCRLIPITLDYAQVSDVAPHGLHSVLNCFTATAQSGFDGRRKASDFPLRCLKLIIATIQTVSFCLVNIIYRGHSNHAMCFTVLNGGSNVMG